MEGCGASVGICMPGIGIPGIWATAGDKPSRTDATTILTVVPGRMAVFLLCTGQTRRGVVNERVILVKG
jgi:hypothetical protein